MLQSHSEGASLKGVSRISRRIYNTVVSVVRQAAHKAQQVHNGEIQQVEVDKLISNEMWSFVQKNRNRVRFETQRRETVGLP